MLDAKQRTLLMVAAKADAIDTVKYLLPLLKNRKDCDGKTASVIAAQYDSYKSIIPLMCEEKASKQLNPIFAAVINNSYHVIKVICDVAREGRTDLLPEVEFSAREQNLCQTQLLAKTLKLDPFPDGYDPLFVAVTRGCSESV